MADYPQLTHIDLANASGYQSADYDARFSATAISQATLLFKIATCLTALPDEGSVHYDLAKMAIISVANQIVYSQPYQKSLASPFTSESIGSYSYSKMAQAVQSKERTGVMWFDLATKEMSVCDEADDAFFYGGVEIFEHDSQFKPGSLGQGNIALLTNSEKAAHQYYLSNPYSSDPYKTLGD